MKSTTVRAIHRRGVLVPSSPIPLPERAEVEIVVRSESWPDDRAMEREALLGELRRLLDRNPFFDEAPPDPPRLEW